MTLTYQECVSFLGVLRKVSAASVAETLRKIASLAGNVGQVQQRRRKTRMPCRRIQPSFVWNLLTPTAPNRPPFITIPRPYLRNAAKKSNKKPFIPGKRWFSKATRPEVEGRVDLDVAACFEASARCSAASVQCPRQSKDGICNERCGWTWTIETGHDVRSRCLVLDAHVSETTRQQRKGKHLEHAAANG